MGAVVVQRVPFTEPFQIEDIPVDGISEVEYRDDGVRVLFHVSHGNDHRGRVRLFFSTEAWTRILDDLRAGRCSAQGDPLH